MTDLLKKTVFIKLIFVLWFTVVVANASEDKAYAVATTTVIYDIAQNIAGNHYKVYSLMPVGADPHIYEPVPSDIRMLSNADLIFKNGLNLKGAVDRLIRQHASDATVVTLTEGIEPIFESDDNQYPDPHAWMDPIMGMSYATKVLEALIHADPGNAHFYRENYRAYIRELRRLDIYIREQIQKIPEDKRILITTHDAFAYYGKRYRIRVEAAMGMSTDADLRLEDMKRIIDIIKAHDIPVVFVESTLNPAMFRQMSVDLGIQIGELLFSDSLDDPENEAGTYVGMLRYNTDAIVRGLSGEFVASPLPLNTFIFFGSIIMFFSITFVFVAYRLKNTGQQLGAKLSAIDIRSLNVSYERKAALTNVYLTFEPGYLYGVVGPNGAGKSTLLKSMLGLIDIDSGHILLGENNLNFYKKHIAYIPQKDEVDWTFPATVLDVVTTGRYADKKIFSFINSTDRKKALSALDDLGIADLRDRQIGTLSGGQQQRLFLARAICQDAEIFMLDEPFVGVDVLTEEKIIKMLKKLVKQGKIIIVIHHDLSRVKDYFDKVVMLNQRVVVQGDTGQVFNTQNIQKTYSSKATLLQKSEGYLQGDNE